MLTPEKRRKILARKRKEWKADPVLFVKEALRGVPDEWQEEAVCSVRDNRRTSIKSGQGVGKTAGTVWTALWFLFSHENARVVATAPTKRQLNDVMWAEMAKWINKSPLLQAILNKTKTYIYVIGAEDTWFAVAVASARPENIQGFHADNLLFIIDEASGVDDSIIEAINGTLTGNNNKLLMLGNPTKAEGAFYESHTVDRALYHCMTVNAETSARTNKENIEAMARKYGRDSNVYRVRVLGEFPTEGDDVVIPISMVERSIMTDWEPFDTPIHIRIACDVARYGNDKTIISQRVDKKVDILHKKNGKSVTWTANTLLFEFKRTLAKYPKYDGYIYMMIDDGGVGGGVTDILVEEKKKNPVLYARMMIVPMLFGKRLTHHRYYWDSTTLWYYTLRDMLSTEDKPDPDIILPDDPDLVAQLTTRKYEMRDSQIKVESKDDYKERMGATSPDEGDSVILLVAPIKEPRKKERKRE